MKLSHTLRFLSAAVLTAICLIFPGCAKDIRPPLLYQDCVLSATVSDGTRTWLLTPIPGGFSLEITAPAHAAGITYRITDTGSAVSAGGMEIPVSETVTTTARQVMALFTLSEENRIGTDRHKGGMTARYKADGGEIAVHLDENGTPLSFDSPAGTWTVLAFAKTAEA